MEPRTLPAYAVSTWQVLLTNVIGAVLVPLYKKEIPMSALWWVVGLSVALMAGGLIYDKAIALARCISCAARVPRSYTETRTETDSRPVCLVCRRRRLEYPASSDNVPERFPCRKCGQRFYSAFMIPENGKDYSICGWCAEQDMSDVTTYTAWPAWISTTIIMSFALLVITAMLRSGI